MADTAFFLKLTQVNVFMAIAACGSQGPIYNRFAFGAGDVAFPADQVAVFAG